MELAAILTILTLTIISLIAIATTLIKSPKKRDTNANNAVSINVCVTDAPEKTISRLKAALDCSLNKAATLPNHTVLSQLHTSIIDTISPLLRKKTSNDTSNTTPLIDATPFLTAKSILTIVSESSILPQKKDSKAFTLRSTFMMLINPSENSQGLSFAICSPHNSTDLQVVRNAPLNEIKQHLERHRLSINLRDIMNFNQGEHEPSTSIHQVINTGNFTAHSTKVSSAS